MNIIEKTKEEVLLELQALRVDFEELELTYQKVIAEFKTKEELLIKNEKFSKHLVEKANEGIWAIDKNQMSIYVNKKMSDMLGYDVDEIMGKPLSDFIFEDDYQLHNMQMNLRKLGGTENFERRFRRKDGSEVWTLVSSTVQYDELGEFDGSFAIISDIAILKQNELIELQRWQHLYKQQEILVKITLSPSLKDGDYEKISKILTENVAHYLQAERISVWLFNDSETELRCIDLFELSKNRHDSGAVLMEYEFKSEFDSLKKSKFVDASNPLTDPRTAGYVEHYIKPLNITSMLDTAIRFSGKNLGAFCIEYVEKEHQWTDLDISFACQIADQIALTLSNLDRKKAEEELKISEMKFRKVVENINEALSIEDCDCNILYCNDKFYELFGYSKDEMKKFPIYGYTAPEWQPILIERHKNRMNGIQEVEEFEYEGIHKDGRRIWIEAKITTLVENGKIIGSQSLESDITQRKLNEKALSESERNFRILFENSPIGVYVAELDGKIIDANNALLNILGSPSIEITKQINVTKFPPLIENGYVEKFNKCISEGIVIELEMPYTSKWGKETYLSSYLIPLKNKDGKVEKIYTLTEDITRRKEAERALKNLSYTFSAVSSVEFFGKVANHLTSTFNVDYAFIGRLTQNNESIEVLACYSHGVEIESFRYELLDTPCLNVIGKAMCYYPNGIQALFPKDNLLKSLNIESYVGCPIFDKAGNAIGIIVMLHSKSIENYNLIETIFNIFVERISSEMERMISEELLQNQNKTLESQYEEYMQLNEILRQTNVDLEISKEKAEESDKLKTAFLQNMSHEIRTPLNGIIGFSNLLNNEANTKEDLKEYTLVIEQSCERLLEIVNNVLDISKIETGQIEVNKTPFSIHSLMTDLYNFYLPLSTKKDLILNYIGDIDENLIAISDEIKIHQIFSNLINNAIKFTSIGKIDYGYKIEDNSIVFYVKDTGIGIEEVFYKKIFKRFMQADLSISRGFEGAGLGLSICKGLVNALGGKIWFESEVNCGTTFYFNIPFDTTNLLPIESNIGIQIIPDIKKVKLLLAEDDHTSYLFIKNFLKNSNYEVIWAKNGKIAVEYVQQIPDIDLILMDIKMPIMDGFEATIQIKKLRPDVPIIAQTAYAFSDERKQILAIGCDDYISKPIQILKLLELIEKYLN